MRFTCLELLELDILGLAETHLAPGEVLGVNGYTWYGHNRKLLHRNAKCGSGGVGFLIREEFESDYGIEIIDDSYEGILWIKMEHKIDKFKYLHVVSTYPQTTHLGKLMYMNSLIQFCLAFISTKIMA